MNFRTFLLFFIALNACLCGKIEDHFKPVYKKSKKHSMGGIDYIYMINLDERPEKFALSANQLKAYNVHPHRFSAVNGWKLSKMALNSLGIKYRNWMCKDLWGTCYLPEDSPSSRHEVMHVLGRNYYSHCLSRGAIGIVLSHLSILQDAYDSGYNTIWVMEDDIEVIKNPHELTGLIKELDHLIGKKSWDILFTDPNTKNRDGSYNPCMGYARRPNFQPDYPQRFGISKDLNKHFKRSGARFGAYSMIVRRSGMKKILDFIKRYGIFLPYDMEYYLPNDIRLISLRYDVVSTLPAALSDNALPNYRDNLPVKLVEEVKNDE